MFQSTRPRRGATSPWLFPHSVVLVSIHAPPKGRDEHLVCSVPQLFGFNPRAPEGARHVLQAESDDVRDVSIHAPPKGRDIIWVIDKFTQLVFQSTRPRRGATFRHALPRSRILCFNPRAPEGARHYTLDKGKVFISFQSTRPRRGATYPEFSNSGQVSGFNPRAPEGARRTDGANWMNATSFQSTRPRRGATYKYCVVRKSIPVSIHAPPKGRDLNSLYLVEVCRCFNPRAPEGARLVPIIRPTIMDMFQSTRPRRGATNSSRPRSALWCVSIHAPPKGRDQFVSAALCVVVCFNPRAPEGARPLIFAGKASGELFQSTRPRRGATENAVDELPVSDVSIHAPPKGRDLAIGALRRIAVEFQSTRPRRGATRPVQVIRCGKKGFNPRAPEGARPRTRAAPTRGKKFQSTRPRRGATGRSRLP